MSRAVAFAAAAVLVVLTGAPAAADDTIWDRIVSSEPTTADPPRKLGPPQGLSGYHKQLWYGDHYTRRAAQMRGMRRSLAHVRVVFKRGINGYQRALELEPDSAEVHLRLAELIHAGYRAPQRPDFFLPVLSPARHWRRRAIHHWEQFQKLAPLDPRIYDILSRRSLEYTRLGTKAGFRKAVSDYAMLIDGTDLDNINADEAGRLTSNRAEIHMMLGELRQSIAWYLKALEYRQDPHWAFGLAVAYDRDGSAMRSREILERYVTKNTAAGFIKELRSGTIFFVPTGEVYYYFALIHQALGNDDLALESFQQFIERGGSGTYHARARRNIDYLRQTLRKRKRKGKALRRPRSHWSRRWHLGHQPGAANF